jgi:hypothetical protein
LREVPRKKEGRMEKRRKGEESGGKCKRKGRGGKLEG